MIDTLFPMVLHHNFFSTVHSKTRNAEEIPDDGTEIGPVTTTHPLDLPIRASLSRSRDPETVVASVDGMRRACNLTTREARQQVTRLLAATKF